jgi:hypothetical protein
MSRTTKRAHGLLSVCLVLLLAPPAIAQEVDSDDAPPFYQPTEHFYNALGRSVTVEWSADRTEVPVGGNIAVTLTVRGATNPHRVHKPNLRDLPKFKAFEVVDSTDPPAAGDAKEVRFKYVLRPRSADVSEIPELQFNYVNLAAPEGKQVRTTYAKKLPIRVTPAASAATAAAGPLIAPERFFRLRDDYAEPTEPGWVGWLGMVLLVPLATAIWVFCWRLLNPGGVRLAKLRRNRAVARALDALARAAKSPDPAANAALAMRVYLIGRWGMPPAAAVPAEVAVALKATELPNERIAAAVEFFRKCDAARFAPCNEGGASLVEDGREMILTWEDVE